MGKTKCIKCNEEMYGVKDDICLPCFIKMVKNIGLVFPVYIKSYFTAEKTKTLYSNYNF